MSIHTAPVHLVDTLYSGDILQDADDGDFCVVSIWVSGSRLVYLFHGYTVEYDSATDLLKYCQAKGMRKVTSGMIPIG